jgi:hypothetical protein
LSFARLLKAYIAELESLVTHLEEENAELLREQVILDSDTLGLCGKLCSIHD